MPGGLRFGPIGAGFAAFSLALALAACQSPQASSIRLDPDRPLAPPRGYVAFCTREPALCDGSGPSSVTLTSQHWTQLLQVNDSVNERLRPADDQAPVGMADDWRIPAGAAAADCEDYVLTKKLELLKRGWPGPALRIAVAEAPGRGRHAVLLADTDRGVFVLDNLSRKVQRWTESGYRWVSVQISTRPDRWVAVASSDTRP